MGAEAEQKADIRFVFATHRNLEQMVKEGKFREDLMYRVSVLRVALPPLRARGGDVALLADAFVARFAQDTGRKGLRLSAAAKVALAHHAFPGNVRELSNIIERAVILAEEEVIEPSDLGLHEPAAAAPVSASRAAEATAGETFSLPEQGIQLEEVEKGFVRQALERTAGNKSKAARLLGLTRATLRYRIEKMGLEDSGGDDG